MEDNVNLILMGEKNQSLINERGPAKNPKSNVKQTKNCYLRF